MKLFCLSILAALASVFGNCAIHSPFTSPEDRPSAKNVEMISEASLGASTGIMGSSFEIKLRADGTARLECDFYKLDKADKPDYPDAEEVCGKMYRRFPADFVLSGAQTYDKTLKGVFIADFPHERFLDGARLIVKNDFFSMKEAYMSDEVRTDSPADRTSVVWNGKLWTVVDQSDAAPDQLSEIKRFIYTAAKELEWKSEKK